MLRAMFRKFFQLVHILQRWYLNGFEIVFTFREGVFWLIFRKAA